ncbi:DUF4235 domain-containing protein [Microlunatus panaciterrae]|uniref:DUF4235 domain-containing protein n=1 Tax=Microlunatus panaciterrae TaxID=400768 RepID=A0ABS2RHI3_9ACTN|nr:DUF4235 domain-containing protein [Microlunatus panaciterrae]MBM7797656.1 hypothetical protein [Microlunatus panaciterrae]
MSKLAKVAYRPFGLVAGLVAGAISGIVFKQVWRRVAHQDDAPAALESEYGLGEIIAAAAIQGAVFATVKALVDRLGAKGFERLTGEWPGS